MNDQEDKFELPPKIERYLATLSKYYDKEGRIGSTDQHCIDDDMHVFYQDQPVMTKHL